MPEELEKRIKELEEKIKKLEDHQHLGTDGSKELSGETPINAKEINIHGAGAFIEEFVALPFHIYDAVQDVQRKRRAAGMGIAIVGDKDAVSEQIQTGIVSGKSKDISTIVPANKTDWDETSFAQMFLIHVPQFPSYPAGPTTFPPWAFLTADRTPIVRGTGTITIGGNTLTDSSADFKNNSFTHSVLFLLPGLEAKRIVSNTKNVITVDDNWATASGTYEYELLTPIFLGAANKPFTRLFVGDDIRLGYGASGGIQVQYIKWGTGSPEGVVTANRGSIFLRKDGAANTTLYVKTSGDGTSSGWTAK